MNREFLIRKKLDFLLTSKGIDGTKMVEESARIYRCLIFDLENLHVLGWMCYSWGLPEFRLISSVSNRQKVYIKLRTLEVILSKISTFKIRKSSWSTGLYFEFIINFYYFFYLTVFLEIALRKVKLPMNNLWVSIL